jgi:hypothetical protein
MNKETTEVKKKDTVIIHNKNTEFVFMFVYEFI